jgi:hypothetical protein
MTLTEQDLHVLKLWNNYKKHDLKESLQEYHFLIDTLIYVHEIISEQAIQIKQWQKLSETLLYKFFFHGLTIQNIFSGITLQSEYYSKEMSGKSIIDISSAKVVLRAQFETFLMYHHIYVNPETEALKELRYYAWIYSSLLQRQDFPAETEYGKKQKEKDRIELGKLREIIANLPAYQKLTDNQQQALIEKGSGKLFNHWAAVLKETGFNESNPFYTIYIMLCIYAHSEGLSVIQLEHQPGGLENTYSQAFLDLHHSKLLVCLMINSITGLFEVAKNRYDTLPNTTKWSIDFYSRLAKLSKE